MSTGLAIAAVTGALRKLLIEGLSRHDLSSVGRWSVDSEPPDRIVTGPDELSRLNLFLYHLSPNQGWRNLGLPSHNGRGADLSHPPLALDLHYMLTAYGAREFSAEILLGYAIQVLHETPVLTRDQIRSTPASFPVLTGSHLADQVEQIKISPQPLSTEEMSKLWTAFQAQHYRPTAAYHASVVLIESARTAGAALPVRRAGLYVLPFAQPFIEALSSDPEVDPESRITAASTLVIAGRGLQGPVTRVRIGDVLGSPPPATVSAAMIKLPLASLPGLRAGVQGVQVVHELPLGEPPRPHHGVESNAAALVLHPTATAEARAIRRGDDLFEGGMPLLSATVRATFRPPVGRTQRVRLLLNEADLAGDHPAHAYTIAAPPENGIVDHPPAPPLVETASVDFTVSAVFPGRYLVRVQVDGAESLLWARQPDGSEVSPDVQIRIP